jgi:hypothetical protein
MTGKLERCTMVYKQHLTFKILHVFKYITKSSRSSWPAKHRKYKRLEVGRGL